MTNWKFFFARRRIDITKWCETRKILTETDLFHAFASLGLSNPTASEIVEILPPPVILTPVEVISSNKHSDDDALEKTIRPARKKRANVEDKQD